MPENSGIPIGNTDWEKSQSILSIGGGGVLWDPLVKELVKGKSQFYF